MAENDTFENLRKQLADQLDVPMTIGIFLTMLEPFFTRIKELESGGIRYRGVFQRADAYRKGDVVTASGAAWIALRDTAGPRPDEAPDAWQLMVKAGRDGRDGHVRS